MQRMRLGRAVTIAAMACALTVAASSSWASAPSRYILRHPKREHCKRHYARRVVTIKKRVHGHTRKVRVTVCVRVHRIIPKPVVPQPQPVLAPIEPYLPPPAPEHRRTRPPPPLPCTTTFTGATDSTWDTTGNWTAGVPSGPSSYGCVLAEYPSTVTFSTTTPSEIGGVMAANPGGIALADGHLTLSDALEPSLIENVRPGEAGVTLEKGVVLQLTGDTGELGGNVWSGPGTLEFPRGSIVRTGDCESWTGKNEGICIGGTPTPGDNGLRVKNFGTIFGAGISLCRNEATTPASLENQGFIHLKSTGGFAGAPSCGEVGSVLNGTKGTLGIAQLDGSGCDMEISIASLINEGLINIGACYEPEVHRSRTEIGSSFSNSGEIIDRAIIDIHGDFTPLHSSDLILGASDLFPPHTPEPNYGIVRVSGDAVLAGELNIEAAHAYPKPGQTYTILEVDGSLSGEFTLGSRCIPAQPGHGYNVNYKFGSKGTVSLEAATVAGC
jgi:hypothetical protein